MSGHSSTIGELAILELREFSGFSAREHRYIRRSLDVAAGKTAALKLWSRNPDEGYSIKAQERLYSDLGPLRKDVPQSYDYGKVSSYMGRLIKLSAFDLGQESLESFSAYRFLYERIISVQVRRWLPSAFCAAAALPHLKPARRKALLQSISESAATAPGWSDRSTIFFPEWIEKNIDQ